VTLTPEREQEIRDGRVLWSTSVVSELLAEVDALRAAGDKLAAFIEGSDEDADQAYDILAGWREPRRG
jgi:hypothetical protein